MKLHAFAPDGTLVFVQLLELVFERHAGWRINGPWTRTDAMPFSTDSSGFDSRSGSFKRASKNATAWFAMACMASAVMSQGWLANRESKAVTPWLRCQKFKKKLTMPEMG